MIPTQNPIRKPEPPKQATNHQNQNVITNLSKGIPWKDTIDNRDGKEIKEENMKKEGVSRDESV